MDWGLFWGATGAAAAVATASATGIVLWLRGHHRPEPRWELSGKVRTEGQATLEEQRFPGLGHLTFTITNAGDGDAYSVDLTGKDCVVSLVEQKDRPGRERSIHIVRPGESHKVRAWYPEGGGRKAALRVFWIPAPTRLNRTIVDVIPLIEGNVEPASGEVFQMWRHRELPWWRLGQRLQQRLARGSRERTRRRIVRERSEENARIEAQHP